jgi:hypothetical protein
MTLPRFSSLPLFVALIIGTTLSARVLVAVDCSVAKPGFPPSNGNIFNLTATEFSTSELQSAIGDWGCSAYLDDIPTFQIGGSGGVPVSVVKIDGNSTSATGSCGQTQPHVENGEVVSAQITIWTHQSNGDSCAPIYDVLAHEFGHLMGLDDAPDPTGQCFGHIMGSRALGGTRSVHDDDCAMADEMWHTNYEDPPNDPYCEAYGCSPILIDMENDGIHLTGLDDPVRFDINADGHVDLISWTDRSEGMLALDRNGNGMIDNGGELFGNATRLANGTRAANGYEALAELDTPAFGGNGNGAIESSDQAFSSLQIWTDLNHDGISQPAELKMLAQAGIQRISLDYKESRRRDRFGNEFRFVGTAWRKGRLGVVHPILTWDVFFLIAH